MMSQSATSPTPFRSIAQQHHQQSKAYRQSCGSSIHSSDDECGQSSTHSMDSPIAVPPSFAQAYRGKMRVEADCQPQQQCYCPSQQSSAVPAPEVNVVKRVQPIRPAPVSVSAPAQQVQQPVALTPEPMPMARKSNPPKKLNKYSRFKFLPFPECCHHQPLVDQLEFVQPPQVVDAGLEVLSGTVYRLFVGQLRFETTAAEVRWLIHYLSGVSALKVELRGTGCCMAYFSSYDELRYVSERLKFRLLFDHTGVWYAREEEQQEFLVRYVQNQVIPMTRASRLPKDMVVIEEERVQTFPEIPSGEWNVCPAPRKHIQPAPVPAPYCVPPPAGPVQQFHQQQVYSYNPYGY